MLICFCNDVKSTSLKLVLFRGEELKVPCIVCNVMSDEDRS